MNHQLKPKPTLPLHRLSASLRTAAPLLGLLLLAGCAAAPSVMELPASSLQREGGARPATEQLPDKATRDADSAERRSPSYRAMPTLVTAEAEAPQQADSQLLAFSDSEPVQLRAERLPLGEFLHQVFDKLLKVSYTIDQALERRLNESVTLNLQQSVSQRQLFLLTRRLLADKTIDVIGRDGIYFITPQDPRRASRELQIGIGREPADVPASDGHVLQIVPLRYGAPRGFQVVLKSLFQVDVNAQEEKQYLFIQGAPDNVRRALGLLALLDAPASRARQIALIDLVYLEPNEFLASLEELMDAEGISLGRAGNKGPVAVVPLARRQAVVVFATDTALLQRVYHWARQLDVPGKTTVKEYFLYRPLHARAADMGESLQKLLSLGTASVAAQAPTHSRAGEGGAGQDGQPEPKSQVASGRIGDTELDMVTDEVQNQLMFYATPAAYEKIRPLLRRLDKMPPQVALEVMVAEVTLTDELQYGLEWFLRKNDYTIGTLGALGLGSSALNITAVNAEVGLEVIANLSKSENLVNVLSRPRIVVSDGQSATVNVGTDIPILTSTASELGTTETGGTILQTVQYRSTGVVLNVTPTVNGQGVVSLELSQEISNTSSDTVPGISSPVISQRSFKTSLLVGDGQTAVVGGLISDNSSRGKSGVPGLADIPLLGNLFSSTTKGRDKTEIVVMITPRIIGDTAALDELAEQLLAGMKQLRRPLSAE